MKKILMIGAGGISSYVAEELQRLILNDQIDIDETEITIADDDEVELKNIKYQNFTKDEIFKKKAEVIGERYCFESKITRIASPEQLKGYDLIVLGVDNSATRKMVYEYCYDNNVYFIDLRAEGRAIAFFTKESDREKMLKSLGDKISEEGSSCQLPYQLENGIIENGNKIVASVGSQLVLNWMRKERNPAEMIMRI